MPPRNTKSNESASSRNVLTKINLVKSEVNAYKVDVSIKFYNTSFNVKNSKNVSLLLYDFEKQKMLFLHEDPTCK